MTATTTERPSRAGWRDDFVVDGERGGPIRLEQVDERNFDLLSVIDYLGETGLEGRVAPDTVEAIRHLRPEQLSGIAATDLASIPGPMRWFVGPYGQHTAAALFHDRLLRAGRPDQITDPYADRYFRHLLAASGVRFLKRWLMWSAVALRTRFRSGGLRSISVALWTTIAVVGTVALIAGLAMGNARLVTFALVAPLPAAALWDKQFGAGVVAAYSFPWLLPPVVVAAVAYGVYRSIESVVGAVLRLVAWLHRSDDRRGRPAATSA